MTDFDAESAMSGSMNWSGHHNNNSASRFDDDDDELISAEGAAYQRQVAALKLRDQQQQKEQQLDQSSRGPTVLARFAKRAICKRVEHARLEQVAARASEVLLAERLRRKKLHQERSSSSASAGLDRGGSSFFCRSTSYGELGEFLNPVQESGGGLSRRGSFVMMEHSMMTGTGAGSVGGGTTGAGVPPSLDVTFEALRDELKGSIPRSGLPTPDIALIIDRFLGADVPVHFIGSLQRLRQTLRDVTRLSKGIRRHMDLHRQTMLSLEEVLDEDAEDEEAARKALDRIGRDGKAKATNKPGRRGGNKSVAPARRTGPRRGLQSGGLPHDVSSSSPSYEQQDDETITFHLVPPAAVSIASASSAAPSSSYAAAEQKQPLSALDAELGPPLPEEGHYDDDEDDDDENGDDHDGTVGAKSKQPAWVGNVPRLRTVRPRTELLERMSTLVQKADVHAARVIDDVEKWRKYSHVPPPFFHNDGTTSENVFFMLHRRYGAGLAFNRACDLLRRYAAGEVFFYVSPFDFSVSSEDGGGDHDGGGASDSMRMAASQVGDDVMENALMHDGDTDDASSPISPIGQALAEIKAVGSFVLDASISSNTPKAGGDGASQSSLSKPGRATAAMPMSSGTTVGKGGGSGSRDMRDKWKKIEREAELQTRYLKRTLTQLAGGWYRPTLKVVTDLLWERHMYAKLQNEGRSDRKATGGSYMRFSSKGSSALGGGMNDGFLDSGFAAPAASSSSSASRAAKKLYGTLQDNRGRSGTPSNSGSYHNHQHFSSGASTAPTTVSSSNNPFSPAVRAQRHAKATAAKEPPRTSVAGATEPEMRLGLDWRFLGAGCYIPVTSKDLRQHLIMCCRNGLQHVARHNPGVGATAGTAVQRLIALNASHLARRYLHLWQAALRRRKKLRRTAAALCLTNLERLRKLRFGTFMKFYNFRNESGRLWRPMLAKVRATLTRRYMHMLFMNRALNITSRAMRRAMYVRYYRVLHFLVVRRRVAGARVTFSQEGDRRKIRSAAAGSTQIALRELAAAAALVNPMQGMKLQMERHYASDGDALRVIAETGGSFKVPSLMAVIACGRRMLPFRRFHDLHDVERARALSDEFLARRELIYEFCVLNMKQFAHGQGIKL